MHPLRYTENQFDAEFIDVLREACFQYIQHQGDATLSDIASFIRNKGFSKVELREGLGFGFSKFKLFTNLKH